MGHRLLKKTTSLDRAFLDNTNTHHSKLILKKKQPLFQNSFSAFNNIDRASLGGLLILLKLNVITINLISKLSLISKNCRRWAVQPY